MMNVLKKFSSAIWVAILGGLAAWAAISAQQQKATAEKWKKRADDEKEADVQAGTRKAEQALTQAKLHESKAEQAKQAAIARVDALGRKDETLAEIVSDWNKS